MLYDCVYESWMLASYAFTLSVDCGKIGYDTPGAGCSVTRLASRSSSGRVPRFPRPLDRSNATEMPRFAPNTPVKSDMPGRLNAIPNPPRIALSPSSDPNSSLPRPCCVLGCHANPMLGAMLFVSVL